ncbi:MAG TPA: hypothetical protein VFB34_07330, partial [Chloroflexota bacterium]|nr:hypothetical protein [Chloroflexota bacterium]
MTASSLCSPGQSVVDRSGNLWVADTADSRVLMFPFDPKLRRPSSQPAKVFGQYDGMTSGGCNDAPPSGSHYPAPNPASAYTLCYPQGLAVDGQGTLYVSDTGNNRVLAYFRAATSTRAQANLVLGQPGFAGASPNAIEAGSTAGMSCPGGTSGQPSRPAGPHQNLAQFALTVKADFHVGSPTKVYVLVKDAGKHTLVPSASVTLDGRQIGITKVK